jgi:hypothetical protein
MSPARPALLTVFSTTQLGHWDDIQHGFVDVSVRNYGFDRMDFLMIFIELSKILDEGLRETQK